MFFYHFFIMRLQLQHVYKTSSNVNICVILAFEDGSLLAETAVVCIYKNKVLKTEVFNIFLY